MTRELEARDEGIRLCIEALRVRALRLHDASLMAAAAWLESEDGRGLMLDLALTAPGLLDEKSAAPKENA